MKIRKIMILFTLLGRIIIIYSVNIIYVILCIFFHWTFTKIHDRNLTVPVLQWFSIVISEHKQFTHEYHFAGIQTLEKPTTYTITPYVTAITGEEKAHSRREIMTPLLPLQGLKYHTICLSTASNQHFVTSAQSSGSVLGGSERRVSVILPERILFIRITSIQFS